MTFRVIMRMTLHSDILSEYSPFCLRKMLTDVNPRPVSSLVASCSAKDSL